MTEPLRRTIALRLLSAHALRGAFAAAVLAGLAACSATPASDFASDKSARIPRGEIKSVGLAINCGSTLRRDHYDLAYPINSIGENIPIPDWKLTTIVHQEVEAALPDARIGDLEVDLLKLVMADMLQTNPFATKYKDYTRAFSGDIESYDYLLAIIPGPAGSKDSSYFGTGLRSRRGPTLLGIEASVGPLEVHATCRAILYDRRSGAVRRAESFTHERLPTDIPSAVPFASYPPETVARFRAPLGRMVRRTAADIMTQLVVTPEVAQ